MHTNYIYFQIILPVGHIGLVQNKPLSYCLAKALCNIIHVLCAFVCMHHIRVRASYVLKYLIFTINSHHNETRPWSYLLAARLLNNSLPSACHHHLPVG